MNVNKFIADSGYCSRREADRLIAEGRVRINGKKAVLGSRVTEADEVVVDAQILKVKSRRIYLAFHKPVGVTTTTDPRDPTNVLRLIDHPERLFPIGRLDKDSHGLLLLTNDGNIVNKILRAGNAHEKEYLVQVNKPITTSFVEAMTKGVHLQDGLTLPTTIETINRQSFKITLIQGLNRQIRRMCEALGYEVIHLKRTRIMHIHLGELKTGKWRNLTPAELHTMMNVVATSDGSEKASRMPKASAKTYVSTSTSSGRKAHLAGAGASGLKTKPTKSTRPAKSTKPAKGPSTPSKPHPPNTPRGRKHR